jgi:Ser/Thr protein kinase RdoA (MazF antagonist)
MRQRPRRLTAAGVPDSVQHDDLHSGNVCWGGSVSRTRVIDRGDASWGLPIGTMLRTLSSVAWHAKCDLDDERVRRVRDAYLEPFTLFADRPALLRAVDLACRTGCVTRAPSYRRAFVGEPAMFQARRDLPVRGWLRELLAD